MQPDDANVTPHWTAFGSCSITDTCAVNAHQLLPGQCAASDLGTQRLAMQELVALDVCELTV